MFQDQCEGLFEEAKPRGEDNDYYDHQINTFTIRSNEVMVSYF